jgi:hypothetical protein
MAWEQVPEAFEWAEEAAADLSAKIGYLVKFDVNGKLVLAAAATDNILGVVREGAIVGKAATFQFGGIGKGVAGGGIAAGNLLTSDSAGKLVATTTGGNRVCGVAMMAADAGEMCSFLITHGVL